MLDAVLPQPPAIHDCCAVLELRQYTLHPGQRDTLINLFDREFVESQEALGIRVVGQFRDTDNPDRFVWIRGFPDMTTRARSLAAFYDGPVWKAHRDQANDTMVDSDNVLLLRPVNAGSGFSLPKERAPVGATERLPSLVVATVYLVDAPVDDEFINFFEGHVRPVMIETGASPIASFQTELAENTFPRLPVRTGENVFVWFASFETLEHYRGHISRLAQSNQWNDAVLPALSRHLTSPPQHLRLEPTARSLLGHSL